ncbi:MAG: DUF2971 domain-containing protein [Myxococcota bacterium]
MAVREIWGDETSDVTSGDARLWRYFKPERFLETLDKRSLYFSSAREFEDPFEGACEVQPHGVPVEEVLERRKHRMPRGLLDYGTVSRAFSAMEQLRRLTKISCWHLAEYESDAMWQLYAGKGKGIAVTTTVDRLRAALKPFRLDPAYGEEEPYAGKVRYVDLSTTRLTVGMERTFFYKHRAFEWEREYRIAISVRMAEEFGVTVPEKGILVDFDPRVLIDEVWIGKNTSEAQQLQIRDRCGQAGLENRLRMSTLLGRPWYF